MTSRSACRPTKIEHASRSATNFLRPAIAVVDAGLVNPARNIRLLRVAGKFRDVRSIVAAVEIRARPGNSPSMITTSGDSSSTAASTDSGHRNQRLGATLPTTSAPPTTSPSSARRSTWQDSSACCRAVRKPVTSTRDTAPWCYAPGRCDQLGTPIRRGTLLLSAKPPSAAG